MKAFILAAGLGTRLRPLTSDRPKVMVEVGGQKILERTIGMLKKVGVTDLVLNTHYFPEAVTEYFGNGEKFGVKIQYSPEPELMGTAGAVKKFEHYFKDEKEFLVVCGDNIFDLDFDPMVNQTLHKGSCCSVLLFDRYKSPNSGAAGGVVEVGEDGNIKAFLEGAKRPDITYVNGGVYKCTPELFKYIPENTFYDFGKEVFPAILNSGKPLQAYIIKETEALFGVDTLEYLEKAKQYFSTIAR